MAESYHLKISAGESGENVNETAAMAKISKNRKWREESSMAENGKC
jgi:hypothetical protein